MDNSSTDVPSLDAPQCGSIAAVGQSSEGLYSGSSDLGDGHDGNFFIAPNGQMLFTSVFDSGSAEAISGSLSLTGQLWTLNTGAKGSASFGAAAPQVIDGTGSFVSRKSIDGAFNKDGKPFGKWGPFRYGAANALAVNQDSVTGQWVNNWDGYSFTIDAAGNLSGLEDHSSIPGAKPGDKFPRCKIAGSVALAEPGTAKNLYRLTVNVSDVPGDELPCYGKGDFTGFAAIVIQPWLGEEKASRQLVFLGMSTKGDIFWTGAKKQ